MMIPSQKAFQVTLFEHSATTVTKRSSNWAYQPTPNITLPLFTAVTSSSYEFISTPFVTRTFLFIDFCRAGKQRLTGQMWPATALSVAGGSIQKYVQIWIFSPRNVSTEAINQNLLLFLLEGTAHG